MRKGAIEVKHNVYLDVPKGHFMAFNFEPDAIFVHAEDYDAIKLNPEHALSLKQHIRAS